MIEFEFKKYIEKHGFSPPTSVHTRISDTMRISTIYRDWGISFVSSYGWETFVWEGEYKQEKIIYSEAHCDIESVLKFHLDNCERTDWSKKDDDE